MPDPKFDDWIDAQLRNVPVPRDLLRRLADDASGASQADARIDAALRDVPVPLNLQWDLRRIARPRRNVPNWLRMGLAASVIVGLAATAISYLNTNVPKNAAQRPRAEDRSLAKKPPQAPRTEQIAAPKRPLNLPPGVSTVAHQDLPAIDIDHPAAEAPVEPSDSPRLPFSLGEVAKVGNSLRQAIDSHRKVQNTFGADGELTSLPRLDVVGLPAQRGVTPPRVRGYDLLFQLRHGEHPFVSPSTRPELATSQLPLTFDTVAYDLAERNTRFGLPATTDEIRVEDFLAAQDYVLPKAPVGSLALHAAAARSPLGDAGLHALQIVVKAGVKPLPQHAATRVILVVDTSWSMADSGRWEATLRALRRFSASLRGADRATLIGFAEEPNLLAEDLTGPQLAEFLKSPKVEHNGASRLLVGFQAAVEAVRASGDKSNRHVVLISPFDENLDTTMLTTAGEALAALKAAGASSQCVRVSRGPADEELARTVGESGSSLATAADPTRLHAALVESLTGQSHLVAAGASLKVTFNPKSVVGYRLVGHEALTITGAATDPLEIDLRAGDSLVGLYELTVKPNDEALVATVELTWRDAASGKVRKSVQMIQRNQMAESFAGAPHWLQQGIVTAKAAEVLRGSHYAPASRPYAQWRELASQVDMQTAQQPSFRQLVDLVGNAEKPR